MLKLYPITIRWRRTVRPAACSLPIVVLTATLLPGRVIGSDESPVRVRHVAEFLTSDGRFDFDRARASGYAGPVDFAPPARAVDARSGVLTFQENPANAAVAAADDHWWPGFARGNFEGPVSALAIYDGALIAAGVFSRVGGAVVNSIARWDGTSWTGLGSGLERDWSRATVTAMLVHAGSLVVFGDFSSAGGVVVGNVAVWNGSYWSQLGSLPGGANMAATFEGDLVAAVQCGLHRWDGNTWSFLARFDHDGSPCVTSVIAFGSELVAGGHFKRVDAVNARNIARWDGSAWRPMGPEWRMEQIGSLTEHAGSLIATGQLTDPDGERHLMALWTGSSWTPFPAQPSASSQFVRAWASAGRLFVAGSSLGVPFFSRWNGDSWDDMSTGLVEVPAAVLTHAGSLIIPGWPGVSRWDGDSWTPFARAPQLNGTVRALAMYRGDLVAGGDFTRASQILVNHVARWDGSSWQPLGTGLGLGTTVNALTVFRGDLIAGGRIQEVDGLTFNHVARWNGVAWEPLGAGVRGSAASVHALGVFGDRLIAGGRFSLAGSDTASSVAAWDGAAWGNLGRGLYGDSRFDPAVVNALAGFAGKLAVAGRFARAGGAAGVRAHQVALWDGATWSALSEAEWKRPGWESPVVHALAVYDGNLVAGGGFTSIGDDSVYSVACWDGERWKPLGRGFRRDPWETGGAVTVSALAVHGDKLYAGGDFRTPRAVARWDGSSWAGLGSGMGAEIDASVLALWADRASLFVGGWFIYAGDKPSRAVARWDETPTGDRTPPKLVVAVLQNPYLTEHLNLYIASSEPLSPTSVRILVAGIPIAARPQDSHGLVWAGEHRIQEPVEIIAVTACAGDLAGNQRCAAVTFRANLVAATNPGMAASADGRMRVIFPAGALARDAYVLVVPVEKEVEGKSRLSDLPQDLPPESLPLAAESLHGYSVSSAEPLVGGTVLVEFDYDDTDLQISPVERLHVDQEGRGPLTSYIDAARRSISARTDGLGVFRLASGDGPVSRLVDARFLRVHPNVPNPFNPNTRLRFEIRSRQWVRVDVLDISGRLVVRLVDATLPPGMQEIQWTARSHGGMPLASGIYICTVRTQNATASRKMLLLH